MSDARVFESGVVDVADELVQRHGPSGAIDRLQRRRQTSNDELQARCTEAIAWIRREVMDDT